MFSFAMEVVVTTLLCCVFLPLLYVWAGGGSDPIDVDKDMDVMVAKGASCPLEPEILGPLEPRYWSVSVQYINMKWMRIAMSI